MNITRGSLLDQSIPEPSEDSIRQPESAGIPLEPTPRDLDTVQEMSARKEHSPHRNLDAVTDPQMETFQTESSPKQPTPEVEEVQKKGKLNKYCTQVEDASRNDNQVLATDRTEVLTDLHKVHMVQTLQALLFIKTLPDVPQSYLDQRSVSLPAPDDPKKTKVAIFDLDETLVHCIEEYENQNVDHVITIHFPDGEVVDAGLNIRPYAMETLRAINENFQVVCFTASHQSYADAVLDFIDPNRELIQTRMYRDNCVETEEGIFIKDLRVIKNREMKDLVLVDNAAYSFGYQVENGIPIIPFYKEKTDRELVHLVQYLTGLVDLDDVREQNKKAFQLSDLGEPEIREYL